MYIQKFGFLIFFTFVLFGCQQQGTMSSGQEEPNAQDSRFMQAEHINDQQASEKTNTEIAQHLSNVAGSVAEVNQASALVAGPYTVVAIDLDEDLDRTRVGSIKYTVSEALYHDPYGKTAVVIADGDLMARLNNMGAQIQQGYPVQGVIEELSAIVGRYMPEFPVRDDQPAETDDNKDILPPDERQQLEDLEQEQSNHNIE